MKKSLADWLTYIQSLHSSAIDLGLQRIEKVASDLGLTEFSCPVITIAGTNGKGSTVCFLESIYRTAGYRVAAYTSPHLLHFNERLRINGESIDNNALVNAFEHIEAVRGDLSLSFFEFTTLAVLSICKQSDFDVLLLEIGLGGRLDAVNVVEPDLPIITNIAIDHVDWLGDNREQIGKEKAGVFRPDKSAVCGDREPPQSVLQMAQEKQVCLSLLGKDFDFESNGDKWNWQGPTFNLTNLPLPQLKLQNAATSLMAIDLMQERLPVTQYAILTGLATAHLPGRFEVSAADDIAVIFDVAHNPQSVAFLAKQLTSYGHSQSFAGKTRAVVAMLKDKDIEAALLPMISLVDEWYAAGLDVPRGEKSVKISAKLAANAVKSCYNSSSVEAGLKKAVSESKPGDRIIVFGSFHTVAAAKQMLEKR